MFKRTFIKTGLLRFTGIFIIQRGVVQPAMQAFGSRPECMAFGKEMLQALK